MKKKPKKAECDYQGSHFGARYPDACCIDGELWDLDSCEQPGGPLYHGGDIPCPKCNTLSYLERIKEEVESGYSSGLNNVKYFWGHVKLCEEENKRATNAALKKLGPVAALTPTAENDEHVTVINNGGRRLEPSGK